MDIEIAPRKPPLKPLLGFRIAHEKVRLPDAVRRLTTVGGVRDTPVGSRLGRQGIVRPRRRQALRR